MTCYGITDMDSFFNTDMFIYDHPDMFIFVDIIGLRENHVCCCFPSPEDVVVNSSKSINGKPENRRKKKIMKKFNHGQAVLCPLFTVQDSLLQRNRLLVTCL